MSDVTQNLHFRIKNIIFTPNFLEIEAVAVVRHLGPKFLNSNGGTIEENRGGTGGDVKASKKMVEEEEEWAVGFR
ncbi:hypothetical protein SDJN02_04343 [Cucurbita argyrosperma subsp. argyrosperma]|nr:hypothetical protein SDJN02_04343 [Cucurbita argyrosperma subsp. argyrosperma]